MVLIFVGLFAAAAFYIFRPFSVARVPESTFPDADDSSPLDELYMTLNELEFDRRTGKLSDEDYDHLSSQYRRRAAELLKRAGTASSPARTDSSDGEERRARIEAELDAEIRQALERGSEEQTT